MAFLYNQHRTSNPPKVRPEITVYRPSKHRLQIRGFKFVGNYEGKRIISIKADQFTIEKKKLGFFRLGLLNVAIFKNAVIDIYGEERDSVKNAVPQPAPPRGEGSQSNTRLPREVSFKKVFRKEALPSFPVKRISSILIEPVSVNLHDEKSIVTQISAASATISLKGRKILFKGNVRVESGARSLMTDYLILLPEDAIIKTERYFVLKRPGEELKGERLTTDIFLNYVHVDQTS